MAELSLARDFQAAEEADWQALVKEALKGAPLSSLRSTSYDGIAIEPLYARAQGASVIPGREPGEAWGVMQRIDLPDDLFGEGTSVAQLYERAEASAQIQEARIRTRMTLRAQWERAARETL